MRNEIFARSNTHTMRSCTIVRIVNEAKIESHALLCAQTWLMALGFYNTRGIGLSSITPVVTSGGEAGDNGAPNVRI